MITGILERDDLINEEAKRYMVREGKGDEKGTRVFYFSPKGRGGV